jgi:hypothetical protein
MAYTFTSSTAPNRSRFGVSQAQVDNVAGGGANLLRPLVDAGFKAGKVRSDAKHAKKQFLLDQRRAKIPSTFVREGRKARGPLTFILLIVGVVIALIVGLAMFASSTASRSSKIGIVAARGGKRVRRVRKKP